LSIPSYKIIQELDGDDLYALLRARRLDDQRPVLLKMARRNPEGRADIELLEYEFETLRELITEGAPRVYEFSRDDGRCYLVLEDRGGAPLQARLNRIEPIWISPSE
jgi:hypothetical protein